MIENEDYELTPGPNDHWHIRILKGDFIETVMAFDKISLDEKSNRLKFKFDIISTPDNDLNCENIGLQTYAGSVLYNLIAEGPISENDKLGANNP